MLMPKGERRVDVRRIGVLLFVAAGLSVFAGTWACGATTGIELGDESDGGGAVESSSDAGDGPAEPWSPFCPESAPAMGSHCPAGLPVTMLGDLECEYGCGDVLGCSGGTWTRSPGHCLCTPDGGASWSCGPGSGCPIRRPRIGSGCSSAGMTCGYEECGTAQECQGGVWRTAPGACGG